METVNPTRMNLLLKREEVNAALTGAELLRSKRDVLLSEFFLCLKPLISLRRLLDEGAHRVLMSLVLALGQEGREKLNSFSFIKQKPPNFRIDYRNLLGLKIPDVIIESEIDSKGQNIAVDTGLIIEETKERFQDFLRLTLRTVPQEVKLKRLGNEIKNTTRKVNSLEKFIIPQLTSQVKFIQETLEEREREDIFRLKRLKRRLFKDRWR